MIQPVFLQKEYDEQGNLIYYDSSYIQAWKHFDFMDSLDLDFHLDSSILQGSYELMPFEEFFPPSFHGPDVFFDRHKEWIVKFQEEFNPQWQQLPGQQKKSARSIEI